MRICLPLLVLIAPAGVARADDLQNRVLAAARAMPADGYAFRRTTVVERTGAARQQLVERYDPRRPAAARWSLVSIDGRPPNKKEAQRAAKAERGPVPAYAGIARWFGSPATRHAAPPGYVLYRFARLPAGVLKLGSHDASADTRAEALVDTRGPVPFVERVRFTSTKGFRMMMVASVTRMDTTARYAQLPGGAVVPAETAGTITGSMLGKSGEIRSVATFADMVAAR